MSRYHTGVSFGPRVRVSEAGSACRRVASERRRVERAAGRRLKRVEGGSRTGGRVVGAESLGASGVEELGGWGQRGSREHAAGGRVCPGPGHVRRPGEQGEAPLGAFAGDIEHLHSSQMRTVTGILEWPERDGGGEPGRLRQVQEATILARPDDPVVPAGMGHRFKLRSGLELTVELGHRTVTPPRAGARRDRDWRPVAAPLVERLVAIEGAEPRGFQGYKAFEELTSIDPRPRLTLEYPGCPASCRLIDLFCPIGRGQRGLIVSPPKAGKTTLLKDIALALLRNHPDVEVFLLLVDERPEEVTDFCRTLARPPGGVNMAEWNPKRARVVASSNDHPVERHILVATMTIERCKRLVEAGKHVVVLLDSVTRLGRAFNNSRRHATGGRTLSGGLDSKALEVPKQIFGAARCTEEAGTLTIIASCLVDTGSVADQVIFEEFKGTGNMELILDRKISERRLFPAINLAESGTRKEELLLSDGEVKTMTALRRRLMAMPPPQQVEQLLAAIKRFPTNAALIGTTA